MISYWQTSAPKDKHLSFEWDELIMELCRTFPHIAKHHWENTVRPKLPKHRGTNKDTIGESDINNTYAFANAMISLGKPEEDSLQYSYLTEALRQTAMEGLYQLLNLFSLPV